MHPHLVVRAVLAGDDIAMIGRDERQVGETIGLVEREAGAWPEVRAGARVPHVVVAAEIRQPDYLGARLAKIRCNVRLCMLNWRAVSDTLRPHSS